MTLKDAIKSSLTILKQVMEEKLNATNIEVCSQSSIICSLLRRDFHRWLICCWDSCMHCPSVFSVACNSRTREDLPHVFQRGAGGRYQGHLEMKKTWGFGQRTTLSFARVELHRRTFSLNKKRLFCNVLILTSCLSASVQLWAALHSKWQENSRGYFCYQSVQQLNLYSKGYLDLHFKSIEQQNGWGCS